VLQVYNTLVTYMDAIILAWFSAMSFAALDWEDATPGVSPSPLTLLPLDMAKRAGRVGSIGLWINRVVGQKWSF